jgi:hypothetical protein
MFGLSEADGVRVAYYVALACLVLAVLRIRNLRKLLDRAVEIIVSLKKESDVPRVCPFPGCGREIPSDNFACRAHWAKMPQTDRTKVAEAYQDYVSKKITLADLRAVQSKALGRYLSGSPAEKGSGEDPEGEKLRKRLVSLAILGQQLLRDLNDWRKTPEQSMEEKKRKAEKLRKIQNLFADACSEVLHPPQKQNELFDNTDDSAKNMPD